MKELSIVMSRSYGPGRYDALYEEGGVDYPVGYVRWTEQRNMEAFLDLVASGTLDMKPLLANQVPIDRGSEAYDAIRHAGAYTAIISFGTAASEPTGLPAQQTRAPIGLRVGLVGAGGFARSIILPNLRSIDGVKFESVATLSGIGAESTRRSFGFSRTQTPTALLADPAIDLVVIASRHDSHAQYVIAGLQAHKAVFVEKPLAVTMEELDKVRLAYAAEPSPFLMVGFNRRFSPAIAHLKRHIENRREPLMFHARINAGFIPRDHWVHKDGGRIIGELCHFIDLARAIVERPIRAVFATALPDVGRYHQDNVAVTLQFADGSVGNVLYLANGDKSVPKEYFEVFCGGRVARIDNFDTVELITNGKTQTIKTRGDKGHAVELQLAADAIRRGKPAPIAFGELCEVSEAVFAVPESIRKGTVIEIGREAVARDPTKLTGSA